MGSVVGPWQLLVTPQHEHYGASASASPAVCGPVLVGAKRHGPSAHSPSFVDLYCNARPLARPRLSDVTSHEYASAESEHMLFSSWQPSQELASPAAPAPGSASSSVSIISAGAAQPHHLVCGGSNQGHYGTMLRQQPAWLYPGSQPAANPLCAASCLPAQFQSVLPAPSSSAATTATTSAACSCGCCRVGTLRLPTASDGVAASFHYHYLPHERPAAAAPLRQPQQHLEQPSYERRYVQPSRAAALLPPLALDRQQQVQFVHQSLPPQQPQQQQQQLVQVAAVAYCRPPAYEAAAPAVGAHAPTLNRPSYSSSYASGTLYTTTSCAATSCDDDVTQCEPQHNSYHALARMQLRMQELIQTLAPVVSTSQALGPQPAAELHSGRCVHPSTHAQLDVFTSAAAPQQEVQGQWRYQRPPPQQQQRQQPPPPDEIYDLPWLLTPLPPTSARAAQHPQPPPQQLGQPLQPQQYDTSSLYMRQVQTQPVPQLPPPRQYQQPAALASHTLRHLLLHQQPQLQQQPQQHPPQQQQGIVVLAALSPPSYLQQQQQQQPVLQQPQQPSRHAQPQEKLLHQQASSAPARNRLPRLCLTVPASNSPYEWIMHVCRALVLTPDTTGRLAAHIFYRVEDATRLMVAARKRAGPGSRDDGAGGAGSMAGAERVYGLAAIWIAAKLEERRREMPRASTLAAVVGTTTGVLAAVELRILQWVDWAPLTGFVPDDSHLLTWGPC